MASKRLDYDKIYELVMQCRKSGLSDRQWCLDNDIVPSTFYYWVRRLRQQARYDLPETECSGRKKDRIKAIYREKDGIVLLYKRLTGSGSYKWPCNQDEVKSLTWKQFEWLMDGLEIEQPKAIRPTEQTM